MAKKYMSKYGATTHTTTIMGPQIIGKHEQKEEKLHSTVFLEYLLRIILAFQKHQDVQAFQQALSVMVLIMVFQRIIITGETLMR